MFLVAYYTGLRRGSLLAICRDDFDLKTELLYVPGENMKNRHGQMFQLGADAVAAIENIWLPQRLLLFPSQHHAGTLSKHFAQIMDAAGLKPGRRKGLSKFHKIRRSVATEIAARAGCAAASSLLGHSGSYVTQRYLDPTRMPGHDVTKILPSLSAG
jgi:integrase